MTLPGMVCTDTSKRTDPVLPGVVAGLHGGCDVHSAVVLLVTHGDGMRRREKPEFLPIGHSHVSRWPPTLPYSGPGPAAAEPPPAKPAAQLTCRRLDAVASAWIPSPAP